MKDFIFFTATFGVAYCLSLLHVGRIYRELGTMLDRKIFPKRWADSILENQKGGPIRIFVHCPACNSFWIAFAASSLWYSPLGSGFPDRLAVSFASVAVTWAVHVILTKLGQYEI